MGIGELIPSSGAPPGPDSRLWRGKILDTAITQTDLLRVAISGADNERHIHGPCPFMPRGAALPQAGERCLVAIGDDGEPEIVSWSPAPARVIKEAPLNIDLPSYNGSLAAALAAVPASGGEIYVPPQSTPRSLGASPLVPAVSSVRIFGGGVQASVIQGTGDIIRPTATIWRLILENLTLESLAGGGHVIAPQGSVDFWTLRNVELIQRNAAKSVWHIDVSGTTYMVNCLFDDIDWEHVGATVASWNLRDSGGGNVNVNRWVNSRSRNTGVAATAPVWRFENNDADTWLYGNVMRDITCQDPQGGILEGLTIQKFEIDNVFAWDLAGSSGTTQDLFRIGKSSLGLASRHNRLKNSGRIAGSLGAGKVDIRLLAAGSFYTLIDACANVTDPNDFIIDCGSNGYVQGRGMDIGATTIQNLGSNSRFEGFGEQMGSEQADPSAPPANAGKLFFRDNGSGKTQACVRFPTGAVQVLATEP